MDCSPIFISLRPVPRGSGKGTRWGRPGLQGAEEGDERVFLVRSQADLEQVVVEQHDVVQRGGAAVVEVGRTRRQTAQRRNLEALRLSGPARGTLRSLQR
jgi:hypothetical protein